MGGSDPRPRLSWEEACVWLSQGVEALQELAESGEGQNLKAVGFIADKLEHVHADLLHHLQEAYEK